MKNAKNEPKFEIDDKTILKKYFIRKSISILTGSQPETDNFQKIRRLNLENSIAKSTSSKNPLLIFCDYIILAKNYHLDL